MKTFSIKRIVITGGPGSGKTTLLEHLDNNTLMCFEEVSRSIIKKAQHNGISQPFLNDPLSFSTELMKERIKQFLHASRFKYHVYDRGIHDILAYMYYVKQDIPDDFVNYCNEMRYDQVFILPPWHEIYVNDNERYESFDFAVRIYEYIVTTYQRFNMSVIKVPLGSVADRVQFINDHL